MGAVFIPPEACTKVGAGPPARTASTRGSPGGTPTAGSGAALGALAVLRTASSMTSPDSSLANWMAVA
jgi:hypothetical protein